MSVEIDTVVSDFHTVFRIVFKTISLLSVYGFLVYILQEFAFIETPEFVAVSHPCHTILGK